MKINFIEKWHGYNFESSTQTTPEFAVFAKEYKAYLKTQLPEAAALVDFSRGHFYCSGFIQRGGKFVYFSMSDVRYQSGSWENCILVRTAKHVKDYTGGSNCFSSLGAFKSAVADLLNR